MRNLSKLAGIVFGIGAGLLSYNSNAQVNFEEIMIRNSINPKNKDTSYVQSKDTTLITYHGDTLVKTQYIGDTIKERKYDPKTNDLLWGRDVILDTSRKVLGEVEVAREYTREELKKSYYDQKNLEKREKLERLIKYNVAKKYDYDELGRVVKIEELAMNIEKGVGEEFYEIDNIKHFSYMNEKGPVIRWDDNNDYGFLSETDKLSIYIREDGRWLELDQKKIYQLMGPKPESSK